MATVLAKMGATPYAIRYDVTGATGGTATKTQADLLTDLAEGPLKALLKAITTDNAWTALNADPRFLISAIEYLSDGGHTDKVLFSWTTAGPGARVISVGMGAGGQSHRLDIRFLPSLVS